MQLGKYFQVWSTSCSDCSWVGVVYDLCTACSTPQVDCNLGKALLGCLFPWFSLLNFWLLNFFFNSLLPISRNYEHLLNCSTCRCLLFFITSQARNLQYFIPNKAIRLKKSYSGLSLPLDWSSTPLHKSSECGEKPTSPGVTPLFCK